MVSEVPDQAQIPTQSQLPNGNKADLTDASTANREVKKDLNTTFNQPIVGSGAVPAVEPPSKQEVRESESESKAKSNESTLPPPPKKLKIRDHATFSWENVGPWDIESSDDKAASLKYIKNVETYITDHFYGDWYWNCSLIIGTCFFSWLVARLGGGILSLGLVLLGTNSVYRLEFRRFNRDIRDDMTRIHANNRLDKEVETMEWMNSFLDKFWVIYMPALSEQVMYQTNLVLKDAAPGFGIDKLSLDEFTLGSKAPRVHSIKTYPKKANDIIEMDWNFSFAPNDTDDMTKNEIKKKIDPKVGLGVTIGKAFVSKSLPILVEDMSFKGRMKIKLTLIENFPHVKIVSVQFLEPPTIDYALKPVGGDTLGLDIMSFIPGLSSFVNGIIHMTLKPMFYAPNHFDVDVEEIMAQQSNDSIGVVAVTIKRLTKLKTGPNTPPNSINPYVQIKLGNNYEIDEKTNVKKLINDPIYNETKYILVQSLDGNKLNFNIFNLLVDKADDQLIGNTDFALGDLLQQEVQTGLIKNITEGGKSVGKIEFDVRYFPTLPPLELEDGTKEPVTDTEIGILKLNLHEARNLELSDSFIGLLNPYAEIYINNELIKTCRKLRQTNEPSWDQSIETLITEQSQTEIQVLVKDSVDNNIVGKLDVNLQDIVFETNRGQHWLTSAPIKEGGVEPRFRITASWKALGMSDDTLVKSHHTSSIGGLRLHLRSAKDLKNLEAVGKVDPYVRVLLNGKLRAKTLIFPETTDPLFDSVYFLPVSNEHQHFLLEIMDYEPEGKDRSLGNAAINVKDFLKKDDKGHFLAYDGAEEIIEQPVIFNKKPTGTLIYSISFIPTIPIYSHHEIVNKDAVIAEVRAKKLKAAKKKEADERLFRQNPKEYEWVEVAGDELPAPDKIEMPLETAIKYRAGAVTVHLLGGTFDKPDIVVHTLFDDQAYSSGVSPRSEGRVLKVSSTGEGFIRDLPNSKIIFRIAKKFEVSYQNDILAERSFDTLDILKKAYDKPLNIKIDDRNSIQVQLEYTPSTVKLPPKDTVLDVGFLKFDIIGAEDLKSVDSNGKSDPFVTISVDGIQLFKTDKKKKTLNPIWNESTEIPILSRSRQVVLLEVFDWDLTHDDRSLGKANLQVSSVEPLTSTEFPVKLDTQGIVNLKVTFRPEYIRPKLSARPGLPIELGAVAGVPLQLVGGAADLAGTALGSGASIATDIGGKGLGIASDIGGKGLGMVGDVSGKGGSFLKGFSRSKKTKKTNGSDDADSTFDNSDVGSTYSQGSKSIPSTPAKSTKGNVIEPTTPKSQYTNDLQSLRSGHPPPNATVAGLEGLPPPQRPSFSHTRNASGGNSDALSFVASINGPDAIPGRINIISASGAKGSSSIEAKVILKTSTRERELFKTRPTKVEKGTDTLKWNESVAFKATTSSELEFQLREHHTFGKSVSLGSTSLPLTDVLNHSDNIDVTVGNVKLTLNIKYFG
ncbi:putative bud/polarization protein [Scheffersomyces amazonensis]|uniref:putative bud/polarization protein n=1 Tax=Scheffersomyces amazonensis TaxID=1078765 RepID=UPI00315D2210